MSLHNLGSSSSSDCTEPTIQVEDAVIGVGVLGQEDGGVCYLIRSTQPPKWDSLFEGFSRHCCNLYISTVLIKNIGLLGFRKPSLRIRNRARICFLQASILVSM